MNRTLVWQLAIRYLRGKRSGNAVPILSRISMVAIAVSSCAMIVLFSVFNGIVFLVSDLYKVFYPEIKITATKGKFFAFNEQQLKSVRTMPGVANITPTIEDNILITSNDEQRVATIKGVDNNYFKVNDLSPYIIDGRDTLSIYPEPTAIVGLQLLNEMGMDINNAFITMNLYYANPQAENLSATSGNAFRSLELKPDGVFRVQDEFDSKYILAPIQMAQELLHAEGRYAAIELKLDKNADAEDIQEQLQKKLGADFTIATRYEQNKTLYMVMRSEKWAVFAILLLVLIIASFNMVGALSLLVLEKQKDMAILRAMGATAATIRNTFIAEGILWSLVGGGAGLVIGLILVVCQQQFAWIKMSGSFIVEAYPVQILWTDFLVVIGTVVTVGTLAAWYPASKAYRADVQLRS